ncbi:MAG: signal peptidase II [Planctomycetes bacterium]|nr:signal peptidase II [Planctomycetota bacterium]
MILRHSILFFAVALAGAGLDLLTQHLAFEHIQRFQEVSVVDGYFSFGRTTNPGVVFGMGAKGKTVWQVISIVAVPVILAIFYTVRKPKWILTISLGMILAGTIGNMYDRVFAQIDGVRIHEVRDFIKFFYRPASGGEKVWPLFNLADAFICVGVLLLTIEMMFFDEKKKSPEEPARAEPSLPAGPSSAPSPGGALEGKPVAGPGPVVEGK